MSDSQVDIALVGGGLMGATLALLLGRAMPSCRIVLFEKNALDVTDAKQLAQPSFDGRSTALSPSSVNVFKRLHLWRDLQFSSAAIQQIHVSDKGHSGWVQMDSSDNQGEPLGYVVENRAMGWLLSQALARQSNIEVCAPGSVEQIQMQKTGAVLYCSSSQRTVTASLVIAADGADSALRQRLGIGSVETDYGQSAVVANVEVARPHHSIAYERFNDLGPLALLPLHAGGHGNRMALVWSLPKAQADSVMALNDQAFLARLQAAFGNRLGRFSRASLRTAYPLKLVLAREQVRSRLLLMGNAAHFLHPVAGQGFNLALRDGLRLLEVLQPLEASQFGRLCTLQEYERRQQADQLRTVLLSDGFNRLFSNRQFSKRALRTAGMFGVQHLPWLRSLFIEQMSGRASPMSKWAEVTL